jgi:hypothetical protein
MIRLSCLLFILFSSVMAQAAVSPAELGIAKVKLGQWQATHASGIELDGLSVLASLEVAQNKVEVPNFMANRLQTLVPLAPTLKKEFRLVLVATENPALRASFPLEARIANVNGVNRLTYASPENSQTDFHFVILAQNDGGLLVSYTRHNGPTLEQGQFTLSPMAQILQE